MEDEFPIHLLSAARPREVTRQGKTVMAGRQCDPSSSGALTGGEVWLPSSLSRWGGLLRILAGRSTCASKV